MTTGGQEEAALGCRRRVIDERAGESRGRSTATAGECLRLRLRVPSANLTAGGRRVFTRGRAGLSDALEGMGRDVSAYGFS